MGGRHREHPRHGTAKLPPITACPLEPTPRPFAPLNDRARQRMRAASTLDVTTGTTIDIPQSLRAAPARPALTFSLCTTASNDDIRILHSPRRSSCARTGPGSPRPPTCTFRVSGSLAFWSPPSYPLPEYERAARQDFPRPNRKLQHTEPVAFPRRATYTSTDRSLCRCHLRYCARAWSPSLSRVPLPCLLKPKAFNAYLDCVNTDRLGNAGVPAAICMRR